MATDRTFSNAPDTEVRPEVRILYYCLRLDNSGLSLKQVNDFLNEEYVSVSIKDIEAILNTTDETHIKVDSLIELANYNGGSDNISCCHWEPIKK